VHVVAEARVVLLTVFRKTRQVERQEVARAIAAHRLASLVMRSTRLRPRCTNVSGDEGDQAMTTRHTRWERTGADEHAEAYEEARAALLLGQMVHDRRTELGMTQAELAERAGMTAAIVAIGVGRRDADGAAVGETGGRTGC